jgi:hypothetical protein
MKYSEKYYELKEKFTSCNGRTTLDESMDLAILPYNSENHWERLFDENAENTNEMVNLGMPDSYFFDNNHFTYPVFLPRTQEKFDKAIILLHGLNERFWDKYLPWAYYLALYTNRPVILFPLSFHMNRAPYEWVNPKLMSSLVDIRKKKYEVTNSSFVNLALSSRLTDDPLRFMRSGHQSAEDLILLTNYLKQGLLPYFKKGTQPDFFSYSIGAFVSQILMLANPEGIFSNSKFFLFCGGTYFKDMCGSSKFIMDSIAYKAINTFYTQGIDESMKEMKTLWAFLSEYKLGKAFYAMLKEENNQNYREERFKDLSNNIKAVALEKDKVIPANGVYDVFKYLGTNASVTEKIDFPYEYTHENPFPVAGKIDHHIVDFWFEEIMNKAIRFLN